MEIPPSSVPTSAVSILSSGHGRMRRAQRLIEKRDLQAALKHGKCEVSYNPRGELCWKYRFADIIYITDASHTREITSFAVPGSGLDVELVTITAEMKRKHDEACWHIKKNHGWWTSHTVVVVDQSGSMRKTDVSGGVTRSDAVWVTLALDFVAKRINSGEAKPKDVISIVCMNADSTVPVEKQPTDWVLFNELVQLLRSCEPHFDGNYLPSRFSVWSSYRADVSAVAAAYPRFPNLKSNIFKLIYCN